MIGWHTVPGLFLISTPVSSFLAQDWAISRNRFWGTPIPLWCSEDMEERVAIGSIAQLEELSGVTVRDAWVMWIGYWWWNAVCVSALPST